MWKPQIEELSKDYNLVPPTFDGHVDDYDTDFVSIENSADKIIDYIKKEKYLSLADSQLVLR